MSDRPCIIRPNGGTTIPANTCFPIVVFLPDCSKPVTINIIDITNPGTVLCEALLISHTPGGSRVGCHGVYQFDEACADELDAGIYLIELTYDGCVQPGLTVEIGSMYHSTGKPLHAARRSMAQKSGRKTTKAAKKQKRSR